MTDSTASPLTSARLRPAIVLSVNEDFCDIVEANQFSRALYATLFPTPRLERLSPGHLVAVGTAPDGSDVVVWRWYDAVVLGEDGSRLRMWEPAHGEVLAQRRYAHQRPPAGTRAYLSAGLPGADWWVAGPATANETAEVELDEVELLYTENELWGTVV